jgi:hypothetical protein
LLLVGLNYSSIRQRQVLCNSLLSDDCDYWSKRRCMLASICNITFQEKNFELTRLLGQLESELIVVET